MKQNDYAIWGGNVVRITSENGNGSYNVCLVETGQIKNNVTCSHISLLIKGVLEALGFKKETASPSYVYVIDTGEIIALIEYTPIPMNRTCTITIHSNTLPNQIFKNILMLDELQGLVRATTSFELPIDQTVLIDAVRRNEHF